MPTRSEKVQLMFEKEMLDEVVGKGRKQRIWFV